MKKIMSLCEECGGEFDRRLRFKKPGKITECQECAEENSEKVLGISVFDDDLFQGVQIFSSREEFNKAMEFEASVSSMFSHKEGRIKIEADTIEELDAIEKQKD